MRPPWSASALDRRRDRAVRAGVFAKRQLMHSGGTAHATGERESGWRRAVGAIPAVAADEQADDEKHAPRIYVTLPETEKATKGSYSQMMNAVPVAA